MGWDAHLSFAGEVSGKLSGAGLELSGWVFTSLCTITSLY